MNITSLLDTDFYKFTMQQIVFHRFSTAEVEYQFFCRTPGIDFSKSFTLIQSRVKALCQVRLKDEELDYLASTGIFKSDYLAFLKDFQLDETTITLTHDTELNVHIKGPWVQTILFETPLLAIINEAYYEALQNNASLEVGHQRLLGKLALLKSEVPSGALKFADFGTRRRFSAAWQAEALMLLKAQAPDYCIGTSNVLYAKQLGLQPIGTMAHEYLQAMQVLAPNLRGSQCFAFEEWLAEYGHQLSIALSDTYTRDVFFKDFNKAFCLAYQGVRQDSGDPLAFAQAFIQHLSQLGIDPKTKTIIFSDSLTFPIMVDLYKTLAGQIQLAFGIGTNLLNDVGFDSLNIVIKMTSCNGSPVAKISDNPEKVMHTDEEYMRHLCESFGIKDRAA